MLPAQKHQEMCFSSINKRCVDGLSSWHLSPSASAKYVNAVLCSGQTVGLMRPVCSADREGGGREENEKEGQRDDVVYWYLIQ